MDATWFLNASVPGTWDPFEVLVRAIVGQQISVKGATTVMGKIVRDFGEIADGQYLFPSPESLAGLVPANLPMPGARADAWRPRQAYAGMYLW